MLYKVKFENGRIILYIDIMNFMFIRGEFPKAQGATNYNKWQFTPIDQVKGYVISTYSPDDASSAEVYWGIRTTCDFVIRPYLP